MERAPVESARPAKADAPKITYLNRELSFLEFNQRILAEAADPEVPLLERLKFVAIVSANLDEFFMIRVAGLRQQRESGVMETGPDGMMPAEQLAAILPRVARQVRDQEAILLGEVLPALAKEGIAVLSTAELSPEAHQTLEAYFHRQVFPTLTPLAVDPGHPFPFLKNRTLNLALRLVPEHGPPGTLPLWAVVQVPTALPRLIEVPHPSAQLAVLPIVEMLRMHVHHLFPGMRIVECAPFRVLRNWDLAFDEDEQEDLLDAVQKELKRRARLDAVLLQLGAQASPNLCAWLAGALRLRPEDVERHEAPILPLTDLYELLDRVGRSDLRDEPFEPVMSADLRDAEDLFAEIGKRDVLLHHPYESYDPVVELLAQAAEDPHVLAIKQTLYRTNKNSPILRSLIAAAENGKQVTALVELKARFDEETNVTWALALESAGVHVVYGMIGLKTHCKVTMIVRREASGVRRYVHIGTGNYNEATAKIYSDLSLFTAREELAGDIANLFNLLTGYSDPPAWKKLIVAPLDLRRRLVDLIERAGSVAKRGGAAKIVLKSNALIDPEVIRPLMKASQAGAAVVLLIRGPCSLQVGIPGWSDKVVVRNVVDRFLEHSRLFYFQTDGLEEVFITSTDIMPRNFERRLEVMVPVEDERLKRRLIDEVLTTELADNVKAAVLQPDGTYLRLRPSKGARVRAQASFIALARQRAGAAEKRPKKKKKKRESG